MSETAMGISPLEQQKLHFQESSWTDDLTARIDASEQKFDASFFQQKLDNLGDQIKKEFAFLPEYNNWLEENNQEKFYEQFSSYLVKLPLRSARNILTAFYSVISTALYVTVHPVKGVHYLAKETVKLFYELTDPQVWSKIGGNSMGLLVGQSMILGNPFSLLGMAIGGALIVGGISADTFLAAFEAEEGKELDHLKERFQSHVKNLPDTVLLGFFTGLFLGGIRRATLANEQPIEIEKIDPIPTPEPNYKQFDVELKLSVIPSESDLSKRLMTIPVQSLGHAMKITRDISDINYFCYMKESCTIGGISFKAGDAMFFAEEPHWQSAQGIAWGGFKSWCE